MSTASLRRDHDLIEKVRKQIREVAIIEFKNDMIGSFREYWSSNILNKI